MADRHGANQYTFDRVKTLDAASVPAGATQVESFTVAGLKKHLPVLVTKKVRNTGLHVIEAECPTDGTLELTFWNTTGTAINPASQDFHIIQP